MATRLKRKAAEVPAVIDISSDTDEGSPITAKPKRKKLASKNADVPFEHLPNAPKTRNTKATATSKRAARSGVLKNPSKSQKEASKSRERKSANDVFQGDNNSKFQSSESKTNIIETATTTQWNKRTTTEQTDGPVVSCFRSFRRGQSWEVYELLAEQEGIDEASSQNIVALFEDENTIPFICRYRRDLIPRDLQPEQLRDIKNTYVALLSLKKRSEGIVKTLEKQGVLTKETENEILAARTVDELDFLYAPYKPANKGSLADRAKALGLDKYADDILNGTSPNLNLATVVATDNPDLDTIEKVVDGICHIISHNISKNTDVLEELRRLQKVHRIVLKCSKAKVSKGKENQNVTGMESKYENYFNFENSIKFIKPHQVLAINRGEKGKFLSVKIEVPLRFRDDIWYFIRKKFLLQGFNYSLRTKIHEMSFENCYAKKLQPLVCRQIRTELNAAAMKASIDVFAKNLKQLLLTSPVKGENILGIDPGFSNGCKLALISKNAEVLETGVIYPHKKFADRAEWGVKLAEMMFRNRCNLIALGNGTACRETELWIAELFQKSILNERDVRYSIVSEQGASIYSCGDVAKKEFPKLDVNLISAVSIARRLNDPLSEYVKIEPKHIGVGMYQHDVNEKSLSETLNEVVTECVSFVGVDINTAGPEILKYIAGLTASRAEKVIEYRNKIGSFKSRQDLLKVKSIGAKTFTQCAGFLRIEPLSVGNSVDNLLDCTWVHPESYNIAKQIIAKCGQKLESVGSPTFVNAINNFRISNSLDTLETMFKVPKERILAVLEALQRILLSDYRSDVDKKPLFKQGITKMSELKKDIIVTGAVTNVTHFGAFVDIGVDRDGLIHSSQMKGRILSIGDRVQTIVLKVDIQKNRIELSLDDGSI